MYIFMKKKQVIYLDKLFLKEPGKMAVVAGCRQVSHHGPVKENITKR